MFTSTPFFRALVLLGLLALGGCASLPDNSDRTESLHYSDTDDTPLGKLVEKRLPAPAEGQPAELPDCHVAGYTSHRDGPAAGTAAPGGVLVLDSCG